MEDDHKENTISVTQSSAAKSQLTSPQLPTSYFYILEDLINLSFHTIPLTISRLLNAVSTTSVSGYGHNIFDVGANELLTALSSQLTKAEVMIHRALVE